VNTESDGFYVYGAGAVVTKNTTTYADSSGVLVNGDGARVEANTSLGTDSAGIEVYGNDFSIVANKVSMAFDGSDGVYVQSRSSAGGGTIERNVVTDVAGDGYYLNVYGVTVRGNKATRAGTSRASGFYVYGANNTLVSNSAVDSAATGVKVEGTTNTLSSNAVQGSAADGIMVSGSANSLQSNVVTGSGGEGLHNEGSSTSVKNNKFLGNRIDVANDLSGGATIGEFTGNTYVTGGTNQQTQVD
jgi:parallel beta-helix repeat protein